MNEEKLKRCPFCGGSASVQSTITEEGCIYTFVECGTCGAQAQRYGSYDNTNESKWKEETKEQAIKAWNKRTKGA